MRALRAKTSAFLVMVALVTTGSGCALLLDLGDSHSDGDIADGQDGQADSEAPDSDAHSDGDTIPDGDDVPDADAPSDADADEEELCPRPYLMVGVEGSAMQPSRVARYSLSGTAVQRCPDLRALLGRPGTPYAIAWIGSIPTLAPRIVALSLSGTVLLIDTDMDTVVGSYEPRRGTHVVSVDRIDGQDGALLVFGLHSSPRYCRMEEFVVYDPVTREVVATQDFRDLQMSDLPGDMTRNYLDPSTVWAIVDDVAAVAFDPITNLVSYDTPYAENPAGVSFLSGYALQHEGTIRMAWTSRPGDQSETYLYHVNDPHGAPGQFPLGPVHCGESHAKLLDAVPDPTDRDGFFAVRGDLVHQPIDIVRLSASGSDSCHSVQGSSDLVEAFRSTLCHGLAIAPISGQ